MKKLLAILAALILCVSALPARATDAVSSATVNITALPEVENKDAKTLVMQTFFEEHLK